MARIERETTNGQTLRVDISDDGKETKISIMKGAHYRGIAKLAFSDADDVASFLVQGLARR